MKIMKKKLVLRYWNIIALKRAIPQPDTLRVFNIKLFFIILIVFSIFSLRLFSQNPSDSELRSVAPIDFTSYTGPQEVVDSLESIIDIGRYLGGFGDRQTIDYAGKYSLIRSLQPEIPEGFDADIIILSPSAGVDHIRNLRYILAGYFEAAYKMPFNESLLLAEFTTYYNAAYRGDIPYFTLKYKGGVLDKVAEDSVGLSTHYSEWPGKTQIVIPLKGDDFLGIEPKPNLDETGNEDVVDEIAKNDPEGNIEKRQDMVNLREENIEEEQKLLDEKKEELAKEEEALKEEIAALESDNADQEEKELLIEKKEELEENSEEQVKAEEKQEELDQRREDLGKERESISEELNKDTENSEEESKSALAAQDAFPFLKVEGTPGGTASFGSIVLLDTNNKTVLKRSEITSIRGTSMVPTSKGILVIAGKPSEGVRLMLLDIVTLEGIKVGDSDIYENSRISRFPEISGNLVVVGNSTSAKLALVDDNLSENAISEINIFPDSAIFVIEGSIMVQDSEGNFAALDPKSLKKRFTIDNN